MKEMTAAKRQELEQKHSEIQKEITRLEGVVKLMQFNKKMAAAAQNEVLRYV